MATMAASAYEVVSIAKEREIFSMVRAMRSLGVRDKKIRYQW